MKKRFAGVVVAMLVLAMGTTVFASQSPTSEDIAAQRAQQLRDSVTTINPSTSDVNVELDKVGEAEIADANEKATSYSEDAEILGMVELKSNQDFKKGVTLTFYVSGVSKGDNVRVLHKLANGSWEVIVPTVGDGYVKATFYSLSPVAIVKYPSNVSVPSSQQVYKEEPSAPADATVDTNTNDTNSSASTSDAQGGNSSSNSSSNVTVNNYYGNRPTSGSGTGTSPKTGQEFPVLPIIGVFALAGAAVVCGKKLV